jgi:hypothetical protein
MIKRHFATAGLTLLVSLLVFGTSGLAQRGKPTRIDTQGKQTPPIELGTSGGNVNHIANGFCCSATLGALVRNAQGNPATRYILSNSHVLAGDLVDGGNGRVSQVGDDVSQPGLADNNCSAAGANLVADLTDWAPLGTQNVDAAIAEVRAGMVAENGSILGIGPISGDTASAFVGQAVKKTGARTGLSRSAVILLDATVNVVYENECAGTSFVVQYTGQIVVANKGSKFVGSGDSGSLMVEDVATNPRAVGLLYASSRFVAIANPISDVLAALNIEMVGAGLTQSGGTGSEGKNAGAQAQGLTRAMQVKARNAGRLQAVPGAVGHAVGVGNRPVIKLLVEEITPGLQGAAPRELEGIPVELEEVGQIRAQTLCVRKQ